LENQTSEPGSGSGLEDLDPLADRILRPKDPDTDSVGFGFVPSSKLNKVQQKALDVVGGRIQNRTEADLPGSSPALLRWFRLSTDPELTH
jgi:hypothetical protein